MDWYVTDVLMRDLVGHDRRPVSFLVYLWLVMEQKRRKGAVQISYGELAENVGVSKSSAQSAVGWLVRRRLLTVSKENATAVPRYAVMSPWRERKSGGKRNRGFLAHAVPSQRAARRANARGAPRSVGALERKILTC